MIIEISPRHTIREAPGDSLRLIYHAMTQDGKPISQIINVDVTEIDQLVSALVEEIARIHGISKMLDNSEKS